MNLIQDQFASVYLLSQFIFLNDYFKNDPHFLITMLQTKHNKLHLQPDGIYNYLAILRTFSKDIYIQICAIQQYQNKINYTIEGY
jgi:hypothetical protein